MDLGLRGSTALVTGISRGIGRAVAERLLAEGAKVVGISRKAPTPALAGVEHVSLDLTDPTAPNRLASELARPFDLVVNNVGGGALSAGFAATTEDEWVDQVRLNLLAPLRVFRAVSPHLQPGSVVVNVTSVNARRPSTTAPVYSAAKAALENVTREWAREYRGRGLRFVAVAPGPVDTDLWLADDGIAAGLSDLTGRPRDEVLREFRSQQPLGRFASAEEVADVVVFAGSPRGVLLAGSVVQADAGLH